MSTRLAFVVMFCFYEEQENNNRGCWAGLVQRKRGEALSTGESDSYVDVGSRFRGGIQRAERNYIITMLHERVWLLI